MFVKIAAKGTVTYEGGSNHSCIVPTSGVGTVNVNWQN
jgi:beta-amylase